MRLKLLVAAVCSACLVFLCGAALAADEGWLDEPLPALDTSAETDETPYWSDWYRYDGVWMREAVNPGDDTEYRWFVDINGRWYALEKNAVEPECTDPPGWYPWSEDPRKDQLPSKGKEDEPGMEREENPSFSWGGWREEYGVSFRLVNPPGPRLLGAVRLVDPLGNCYIEVVYPGAQPREVDRFVWFPGFPPGWLIKPGTGVLVEQ
ncbi:MAG: hypothetical protein U9R40_02055 [Synergistota bacterium]|nr:hypothetical protein [Synergistota bacterium]